MNSNSFNHPSMNKVLAVSANLEIKLQSPYNAGITSRIYSEPAEEPIRGYFYLYVLINSVRKYFKVAGPTTDTNIADNRRYSLVLSDTKSIDGLWFFRQSLFVMGNYSSLLPLRTICSYNTFTFTQADHEGSRDSSVNFFYDSTGAAGLIRYKTITEAVEKESCVFLMDNRKFKLSSARDTTKVLGASQVDQPSLTISSASWRIDPVNQQAGTFGGRYFLIFPNATIDPANSNLEKKLYADGDILSINTSGDTSTKSQWELLFIQGTGEFLLQHVYSGKILALDSAGSGLVFENNYDASDALLNDAGSRRKRWKLECMSNLLSV